MKFAIFVLPVLLATPALADEAGAPAKTSAFADVMQAQYAAKQAAIPASAAEADRIYDAYLHSIGKPVQNSSSNSGTNAGTPSH